MRRFMLVLWVAAIAWIVVGIFRQPPLEELVMVHHLPNLVVNTIMIGWVEYEKSRG